MFYDVYISYMCIPRGSAIILSYYRNISFVLNY